MSTKGGRLPEEIKIKIAEALEKSGLNLPCPRCGNEDFFIADGYIVHILQENSFKHSLEGAGLICVAVICQKCGFISEHSLGTLGIVDEIREYDAKRTNN